MLITTGRKPDAASRAIARALGAAIPLSLLEGRGRRTLFAIISKARKRRLTRVCTIYKEEGKPCSLSFLSVGAGWTQLSPKIIITKVKQLAAAGKGQSGSLKIAGSKAGVLRELIRPHGCEGAPDSKITAGASKITIAAQGKKLVELGVKYEG